MRLTRILLTVAALGLTGANVFGQTTYDGDVTPDVIFGSGNANGGFTIQRSAGRRTGTSRQAERKCERLSGKHL